MSIDIEKIFVHEGPDALVAITPNGKILFWNKSAEDIFGFTAEEAVGKSLVELTVPPDLVEEANNAMDQVMKSGSMVYESVRNRKDGSPVYVNISKKAVRDADGNVEFIAVSNKDITHLRVLRDARLVETKFGGLLESTPDAIVIVNNTGRIVLVNSQAEKLFGYAKSDLIGNNVEILLPQRYREAHVPHRSHYFIEPKTRSMGAGLELFGIRKDGTEFPVEISLSPLELEEGILAMSAIRDITDRKKAEAKFRGLLESAPDAMVIVSPGGRIVMVNAQAEKLFGYKREELLNRYVEMLLPGEFHNAHVQYRDGYFANPQARPMGAGRDLSGRRKDGTQFPAEISLSPLDTEEGMLVMAAVRDITDRKVQEELRRKSLQEANRLKSEFLANMSHELRTPLNGIIGFAEFLSDGKPGPLNEKQKEYLNDILTSGRHLLDLINDVLDLAKVEAGKMELFPERFSVREAVEQVCSALMPLASKKSILLSKHLSPEIDLVFLDLQKFKQILYNLLSNAVKFTNTSGLIEITTNPHSDQSWKIAVRDTGIGIRNEDFERLFIEFQQLESGADRHFGGTGLGLALTKKLVEFQKGSIAVESEPGKGTTFTVTFPITVSEALT